MANLNELCSVIEDTLQLKGLSALQDRDIFCNCILDIASEYSGSASQQVRIMINALSQPMMDRLFSASMKDADALKDAVNHIYLLFTDDHGLDSAKAKSITDALYEGIASFKGWKTPKQPPIFPEDPPVFPEDPPTYPNPPVKPLPEDPPITTTTTVEKNKKEEEERLKRQQGKSAATKGTNGPHWLVYALLFIVVIGIIWFVIVTFLSVLEERFGGMNSSLIIWGIVILFVIICGIFGGSKKSK